VWRFYKKTDAGPCGMQGLEVNGSKKKPLCGMLKDKLFLMLRPAAWARGENKFFQWDAENLLSVNFNLLTE
jgi:hypothetical protein